MANQSKYLLFSVFLFPARDELKPRYDPTK